MGVFFFSVFSSYLTVAIIILHAINILPYFSGDLQGARQLGVGIRARTVALFSAGDDMSLGAHSGVPFQVRFGADTRRYACSFTLFEKGASPILSDCVFPARHRFFFCFQKKSR